MKLARLATPLLAVMLLGSLAPLAAPPHPVASLTPSDVPAAERAALVALYTATGGAGWKNNTGWLSGTSACYWYGVSCDAQFHVTHLLLGDNGLTGALPSQLGDLSSLRYLNLSRNRLTGPIPTTLGDIVTLEGVWLSENQLEGPIPASLFARTSLVQLSLGHNLLTGPLPPFGNLTSLTELYLDGNRINGPVPESIGKLSGIVMLNMNHNQLSGPLPASIGNLKALRALELAENQLEGLLPATLGNLSSLTRLILYDNRITGPLPPELGSLTNLNVLDLDGNRLTGSIPEGLAFLPNLQQLWLADNNLTGELPGDADVSAAAPADRYRALQVLDVSNNHLSGDFGHLGKALGRAGKVAALLMRNNALEGSIPPELGNIQTLQVLNLEGNRLSGAIPAEIGNLSGLQILNVMSNTLSGTVPALYKLTQLRILNLAGNVLRGALPPGLGDLRQLQELRLGNNLFDAAPLPRELPDLDLTRFDYSGTQLCAPGDATFQAWLDGIAAAGALQTSGLTCGGDPVSVVVARTRISTLASSADRTTYTFAPETFPDQTTVTHKPLGGGEALAAVLAASGGASTLAGIGHTYEVGARDGEGQPVQPARPYSVTIGFSANQTAGVLEATLALYVWDGAGWRPEPTSRVDLTRRIVSAAPSHLSRWAVLGQARQAEPAARFYLPWLTRGGP